MTPKFVHHEVHNILCYKNLKPMLIDGSLNKCLTNVEEKLINGKRTYDADWSQMQMQREQCVISERKMNERWRMLVSWSYLFSHIMMGFGVRYNHIYMT